MIKVKDINGSTIKLEVRSFSYQGNFMGESFISFDVNSPVCINFEIGDYIEYRGERFVLNYIPSPIKNGTPGKSGDAFEYRDVKFNSLADELTRCDFLDVVLSDNHVHFTSLSKFSFYAATVKDLADRIQANLNRLYNGGEAWTVTVEEDVAVKDKSLSVDNINCWEALSLVNSDFDANFVISGRTIRIGTAGISVGTVFGYGKGNGLINIEQSTNNDSLIVTRLRAYGSTRNIPYRYYNNLKDSNGTPLIPESMYVNNLMLPGFAENGGDAYVDSPNIARIGIREKSVYFDGSGGLPEIYPSIEGMTAEELKAAGINVNATGRIDEIVSAERMTDDGIVPEGKEELDKKTFTITLKDIGFNPVDKEHLTTETPLISMKTGMCGGREFEITGCEEKGNNYVLTCNREMDSSINKAFPNNPYQVSAGDQFVFIGIAMDDIYIKAAEQRLLTAAKDYLSNNDKSKYTYLPKIDKVFMARHPEIASSLKEGNILDFKDTDLGIDVSVIIQSLVIKEGGPVPEYEITLFNDKVVSTIEKIQNSITSLASNIGITIEQAKSLFATWVEAWRVKWFDQKLHTYDPVKFNSVTSTDFESRLKGWVIDALGNAEFRDVLLRSFKSWNFAAGPLGAGVGMVNDDELQTDKLLVRKIMYVLEMMIQRMRFQGGIMVLSPATGFKVDRVETFDTYYRVYCRPEDFNEFEVNDQARIQNFNGNNIKYLWSLVLSRGDDYIDISRVDKDGYGVPAEGDEIVQLGNRTNPDRQDAVLLSAVNGEVGIFTYYGINSFDLSSKEGSWLGKHGGKKGAVIRGEVHITSNSSGLDNFSEFEGVSQDIQDAQASANTAQSAANAAQSAANQAQADANAANSKLATWASDNYISPQEKTALRQQKSDIQGEYNDIEANANRYNISLTSYSTAYNSAIAALNKYTATSPENIQVIQSEYDNISAYYPARQTILNSIAAAAKAQADKATGAIGMDGGKILYADPEFKKGLNGVGKYTNSSNVSPDYIASKLTVERVTKPSDAPTQSGYCLKVTCKAAQSPGYGGVYQPITSRANAVFVQKIIAKIPVGYKINTASYSMGAGYSDTWLTPTEGTGKYTTYLRKVVCGTTGNFSTGGYVYINGSPAPTEAKPLEWYIAYMTAFDLTADGYGDIEYNAKDDLAQQLGYSNFDEMVTAAKKGDTLIDGGYINTQLIDVETLVADTALVDKLIGRELNFTLGSVGGFKMESTLLYSGAKFGTGGAGIAMQSMTNNYGFNVYRDNDNYMEMFQRSSEWGLKGVVGGKTILQLGSTNKIGGFDITDDRIGSIFGTGGVGNGMSLYNFVVKFKSDNSEDSRFAALGTSVYPSSTAQSTLLRLEETRSGNLDNILSYFYCSGASGVLDSRNIAIKVGKGDVDIDNGNLNMAAGNFMKMKGQIHFDNVVTYTGSGAVTITADSGHFIYLTPITGNPVVSVSSGLPIGSWFIIAHATTAGGYYYIKLSGSDRFRRRGNAYQQVNSHNQDPSLIFKVSDTTWIIGNLPVNWIDWN